MNRKAITKKVSAVLRADPEYRALKPAEKIAFRQRVLGQVCASGVTR